MSQWNSANTPKPSGLSQTPIPLPQLPGLTYRTSVPSTTHPPAAPKPSQNAPTISSQTSQKATPRPTPTQSQSPSQGRLPSQSQSSSRISVVLRPPATPHQYHDADADELGNDELVMSDLTPQFRRKVTQQVQQASALSREARQTSAPTPKATTPVLPRTVRTMTTATSSPRRTKTPTQPSSAAESPKPKPQRLGRPKGWKPGMSYADVWRFGPEVAAENARLNPTKSAEKVAPKRPGRPRAAATQPNYYSGVPKRRGRPPKPPPPTPRAIYDGLQPRYIQFQCEWEKCQAELHNLETLRKHVRIVHCGGAMPATCLWGDCAVKAYPPKFATREALLGHVEARHVTPFAWHVGDGPRISMPDSTDVVCKTSPTDGGEEQLPDFLFDQDGNQVTPSVRDQQIEDFATWKERRKKLKALLRKINDALPEEEESGASDDENMHYAPLLGGTSGF